MRLRKMIIKLLRIQQWYKNLLIFLPLIFSGNLFNVEALTITSIGFFALCLISSSQYIINDIIDIKKDKLHPEKKYRPIAAGKIERLTAFMLSILLFITGFLISYSLNETFGMLVLILAIISTTYTFWLKRQTIADVIAISTNFVIRAISGAFLINVIISPWLIIGVFFLAFFLVTGKRHAELIYLGKNAGKIRETLQGYTKETTTAMMIIATTLLLMSYALYTFFSLHQGLLITLPFALYTILTYFTLVLNGDKITRSPEKAITNIKLFIGTFLWIIITFIIIYKEQLFV